MNTAVMSQGGRVVVPKQYREKLGVKEGDEVIWTEVDGQIVPTSRRQEFERAERFFERLMADYAGTSLADELIAERRAEAAREDAQESAHE
ncbi:AbrB/MazE/SpoVT family DNA-binding domain-containing protein [Methyloversatilis sp.]|uniref:AbrB/MazE/SpoVT family DNA-binding domain-containing protein n=1 Tax=Methyloversatilis sp. TaxID=2569862 RepID=UPI0035B11BAF